MHNCNRGYTLFEMLVASFLGSLFMAMALTTTIANKRVMGRDFVRTRLNQNLRGALDVVGFDVRIAGENLPMSFPAILLTNGTSDVFTVRRNQIDEVLNVCANIAMGSTANVVFASGASPSSCVFANNTNNYNAWRNFRLNKGGVARAYIYDRVNKVGEFFNYSNEATSASTYALVRSGGSWSRAYSANAASVYLLEEWEYRLTGDTLQLIENGQTSAPYNVSFGIKDFQVTITDSNNVSYTSFSSANDWSLISRISISITGQEQFQRKPMIRTLQGTFFPRNVLSV